MFTLMLIFPLVQAEQPRSAIMREPYSISGTVYYENGKTVSDATVIVTRLRTGETNLKNADGTTKDNYFPSEIQVTTNSQGHYYYDLSNMAQFNDDDRFKVKATKRDESGDETVKIDTDTTPGYKNADIVIKAQPVLDICFISLLFLIIFIICAVYKSIR